MNKCPICRSKNVKIVPDEGSKTGAVECHKCGYEKEFKYVVDPYVEIEEQWNQETRISYPQAMLGRRGRQ